MRCTTKWVFILFAAFSISSCSSKPAVRPAPEYRYEKDAIRLRLKADPQLNLYQKSPHTLLTCTYQLSDPNAFNQLIQEKEGLSRLLECGRFDPTVAGSKRLVIQPGQELNETLDRAEGARYVGFVAGYYFFQKDSAIRLLPVPVVEETKGVISRTKTAKPGALDIRLYLGPQGVHDIVETKGK